MDLDDDEDEDWMSEEPKQATVAGAPWWAQLVARYGASAVIAAGLVYYLGESLRSMPVSMERQVDRLAAAIREAADLQIRSNEAAERRAEERTRLAVERLLLEIQKESKNR